MSAATKAPSTSGSTTASAAGTQATGTQSTTASTQQSATPVMVSPNQYHLTGNGLMISYFPDGRGPIGPAGATHLIYQDATQTLSFTANDIQMTDVPDLGTILSVAIRRTVDVGFTSFSMILPHLRLPHILGASAPVHTEGITTMHRSFLGGIGHAQAESYAVTDLSGTASVGILAL